MRVLFAVLAAVALAQKKKKVPMACFGLEDEDHLACKPLSKENCGNNNKCSYGKDRVEKKKVDLDNCMTKQKAKTGALCDKPGEIDTCKCGLVCHRIEWMQKNVCSTCADMGIKEDCDSAPEDLSCKWLGTEDEGVCILGKDDCSELDKKSCMAAAKMGKCKYLSKAKKCMKDYVASCSGKIEGSHDKCYDKKSKEDCMNVKSAFSKPLCQWGYDPYNREDKHAKCIEDVGEMGKACTNQADCQCGSTCLELDFGFAKISSCSICKDMGVKADCDTAAAAGMGCKWVGEEGAGVCMKKDMCKELMFEEDKCNAKDLCEYKNSTCMNKEVTKKTCKSIGKRKKGEPKNEETIKEAKVKCNMIPECQFTSKNKCVFRKQK